LSWLDGLAPGSTRWREASWCAVDLELTGLDPSRDEIVAFGAVPIESGRVQLGGARWGLVRPARASEPPAVLIHGLRSADLASASPVEEALEPLIEALAGRVPVFHTAAIERQMLDPVLRRRGIRLARTCADTVVLGQRWLRSERRPSLDRLAKALRVPADSPHDALSDALTTAQVFVALATHLETDGPQTVRSLTRAGWSRGGGRFAPVTA
jgi:DNA polymerase-3 subunit epsilon